MFKTGTPTYTRIQLKMITGVQCGLLWVLYSQIVEQIYKAHRWSVQYVVGGGERGRAICRVGDRYVEVEASTFYIMMMYVCVRVHMTC